MLSINLRKFLYKESEPLNLLFLDESFNPEINLTGLTGIMIPVEQFSEIRDSFYKLILDQFIFPDESVVNTTPPEMHAVSLLRGTPYESNDDLKFNIFNSAVKIINEHNISIIRLTTNQKKPAMALKNIDQKLMGIVFPYFIKRIDKYLKHKKMLIVMDGLDSKISSIFSQHLKIYDILRRHNKIDNDSLFARHTANILGETYYADSKYSIFTQLVDLVGYLLQCRDHKLRTKSCTEFKLRLVEICEKIDGKLLDNHHIHFEFR